MPQSMNDLPLPLNRNCPDYDALWSALERTYNTLAHLRAHTAIAAMHDLSLIKDLPYTTDARNEFSRAA